MPPIRKAILLFALSLAPATAIAGQNMTIEQVPPAVRATIERETKGGAITDIEKDREGDKDIFEVEFTQDGKKYELDIALDGTLLERRLD
jgi:uncharacterized protein YpmB